MQQQRVESQSQPRTRQLIDERRGARISCCRVGHMTLDPFSNAPLNLSVALRSLPSAIRKGDKPQTYEMGVPLLIKITPMAAQLARHRLLDAIQACRRAIPAQSESHETRRHKGV